MIAALATAYAIACAFRDRHKIRLKLHRIARWQWLARSWEANAANPPSDAIMELVERVRRSGWSGGVTSIYRPPGRSTHGYKGPDLVYADRDGRTMIADIKTEEDR